MTGTWSIESTPSSSEMQVGLTYRTGQDSDEESHAVPFDPATFPGLDRSTLQSDSRAVRFTIVRDAGSFACDGAFRGGAGSGVFTFEPSDAYARAVAARGLGALDPGDQLRLAMSDMTLSTIDLLLATHVSGLSGHELVRLAEHGVSGNYVRSIEASGVRPQSTDDWVALLDHGVDAAFAAGLVRDGFHPSVDDLVQLRDHGATTAFVDGLIRDGYHPSVDDVVRLCDHGVTLAFIADLRAHGYDPSIDDLIRLRDTGM